MTKLTMLATASALMIAAAALAPAPSQAAPVSAAVESSQAAAKLHYAWALTFSTDGVLFVGDNISGAVFAYPTSAGAAPTKPVALDIEATMAGSPNDRLSDDGHLVGPAWRALSG